MPRATTRRRMARTPQSPASEVLPDTAPAVEAVAPPAPDALPVAPAATKSATVLALLQRDEGATIAEIIAVTGWLPHTTRAALTGFRKKGHVLDKSRRDGATCYRAVKPA